MSADKDPKQQGSEPKESEHTQQQQSGSGEQYGEGSYKGARQYNEGLKEHVQNHDIEREARDAAPRNAAEEQEMEEAERIGRSKSKGEGSPDAGESPDEGKVG